MAKPPFRTADAGSFLRPKALIAARDACRAGTIDASALRDVVRRQEAFGLQGITDGKCRRARFHTDFLLRLDGVEKAGGNYAQFHQHGGKALEYAPPVMKITGRVAHARDIQRADYEFFASCTTRTSKVTIPSPTTT